MRTTRVLTAIAATLALLALPAAPQARGKGHPQRSAGVVRSFHDGVLTIRLAGGAVKAGAVNDSTELTCQADRPKRSKRRVKSRRRRAHVRRARTAVDLGVSDGDEPGADPGAGDDTGDDTGDGSDSGDDQGDSTGDDAGDGTGDGADEQAPAGKPHPVKHACSTATLRRGMRVKVAKLGSGPDGAVWTRVALLRRRR
jgi:hypothetical protein